MRTQPAGSATLPRWMPVNLTGAYLEATIEGTAAEVTVETVHGNVKVTGGNGNDTLDGGPGDDSLVGGVGNDLADYQRSTNAVLVNLNTGSSSGGSPTALLRWMVSFALAKPKSSVRNSGGQSLAVGILSVLGA